ncbi:MAG: peptidoglycan-associated lipoprotein Pal [Pseudomonadota bacterium]
MEFKTILKGIGVAAAVGLLSACATQPPNTGLVIPDEQVAAEPTGPAPGSQEDLAVNVGNRVFFALDRYDLSSDARATLARQAAWMKAYPENMMRIEGNCDERGTREYNLALGARRANAVKDYLVSQGVDAARVQTISYGKERPICAESNENCWSLNRNGTTVVAGVGS